MNQDFNRFLLPLLVMLIASTGLLALRAIAFRVLQRWAEKTSSKLDDIIIASLRTPTIFWCIAIGLFLGIGNLDIPEKQGLYLNRTIYVIIIFSVTIAAANLAGRMFGNYVQRSSAAIPGTGLVNAVIKGSVIVTGVLVILSILGISITPIITALGVGGLAVALALQDTLANLFAGIHILMENSLRVGDFIRLENGQEGYIADITWRTTRIRTLTGNMVIIPNSSLAKSTVINYHLPTKAASVTVTVNAGYGADMEKVETILKEEAKAVLAAFDHPEGDDEPVVRYSDMGESSVGFSVALTISTVSDQFAVRHELRKRILKRFRAEGIEPPYQRRIIEISKSV